MADKETRRGVGELTNLVGRMTQIREPSPQDTGAALIASFSPVSYTQPTLPTIYPV